MTEVLSEGELARRVRAADAMRRLSHALLGRDVGDDDLDELAGEVEAWAAKLEAHPTRTRPRRDPVERYLEPLPPDGADLNTFPERPFSGRAHPFGFPIEARRHGDEAVAVFELGPAHEGAPGRSHGGFVAAAFDEVLGFAQASSGNPGMTGTLTIRYRKPTPLHTPLRFEARITRTEGRKSYTEGRLYAGDLLCAESDAIFVTIDRDRFRRLLDTRPRPRRR